MDKGERGMRFGITIAILITVAIGGLSFGIARYEVEKSKPNKEQTYTLANKYYDAGDFASAANLYERYYNEFEMREPTVRIDYGYSLFKSGKRDEGLMMTKSVFDIDPQNGAAQFNLAFMYFEIDKKEQAIDWLKKCAVNTRDTDIASRARAALVELTQQK